MRAANVFFKTWCDDSVPELDEEEIKESIDEHGEYLYDDMERAPKKTSKLVQVSPQQGRRQRSPPRRAGIYSGDSLPPLAQRVGLWAMVGFGLWILLRRELR